MIQILAMIVGAVGAYLIGQEFGTNVGTAVFCLAYMLMPYNK